MGEGGDAELGGEQLGLGAVRAAQAGEEALEAALLGHLGLGLGLGLGVGLGVGLGLGLGLGLGPPHHH